MNLKDRAELATSRMLEFYEPNELEQFVDFVDENNFPQYEAMLFLDGQTRMDYLIFNMEPSIIDYMQRTYYRFITE